MIRCAHGAFGEHPCTDEAELIMDGRGLCEAHAMDRDYDRRQQMLREIDAFEVRCSAAREAMQDSLRIMQDAHARRNAMASRSWLHRWKPSPKRFSRADVKPTA